MPAPIQHVAKNYSKVTAVTSLMKVAAKCRNAAQSCSHAREDDTPKAHACSRPCCPATRSRPGAQTRRTPCSVVHVRFVVEVLPRRLQGCHPEEFKGGSSGQSGLGLAKHGVDSREGIQRPDATN